MQPVIEVATWLQSLGAIGAFILLVVKATLLLLLARVVLAAIPRTSAATRHIVLTAALCGVLILPVLAFVAPSWHVALLPDVAGDAARSRAIGTTGDDDSAPTALEAAITVARATGVVPQERLTAMARMLETVKNSWQGWLLITIAGVSFAFLLRIVLGAAGVALVARRASVIADEESLRELDAATDHLRIGQDVRLLRSTEISVPVVWSVVKPVLMLPASSSTWTTERLRVVLLHELAHVKRWDGVTLLVTRAAVALFWFHPLAWSLERDARGECERACDDLVLASGAKPSDYAEHLLSIARALPHNDPFRSVTLAMSRRSQLEGRLLSILEPKARRERFSLRALSMLTAGALMVIVPLASVRLTAAPQEKREREREPIVEIGPSVAAKVTGAPEMILAGIERLKHKHSHTPSDGSEWYGRGHELYRHDRYDDAIAAFRKSVEHGHRVAASKYNIACSYALKDDAANAVLWLEDAIRSGWDDYRHIARDSDFDPIRSTPAFQELVASLDERQARKSDRRIEDTLDRYDRLRAAGSANGGEWLSVGRDLLRLRRLDQSIDAFAHAVRTDSKTATALYNMACAYSLKGDVRAAADTLERAIEHGFDNTKKLNNDPDLRNLRGQVAMGPYIELAEDLKLRKDTSGMRWLLFTHGDGAAWRDELQHYRDMTRKHPTLGRTWFNLGYAELQAGDNEASARSFQKAIELGYRPAASTYNVACAYARAGQNDAAFDWLHKARLAGFDLDDYLGDDDDLENLYRDPRWRELRRQVRMDREAAEKTF